VGSPLKFLRGSPKPVLPPPLLGQHTREVLRGLGYTAKRIEALARSGVIALPEGQG
jgi:crotonobetainyl-CoA:carnitine CoA-transferase CaiB-like acyl-CoA transferase